MLIKLNKFKNWIKEWTKSKKMNKDFDQKIIESLNSRN